MFDRSELTRPGSSMTGRPSPGGAFISSGQALGMLAIVPSMRGSSAAHCALEGARGTAAVPEISFAIALMIDGFDGHRNARSRFSAARRVARLDDPAGLGALHRERAWRVGHLVRAPGEVAPRPRVGGVSARARRTQAFQARHP